jgi:hypothetical protein
MTLHTPLWAQNATYSARLDRQLIDAVFDDPHVVNGLTVTQRGLGANMSVDIAAGTVVMPGPLGNYLAVSDEVENRTVGAAPAAGTSRKDLVVAQAYDPQAMGSGTDVEWDIEVIPGTASVSPSAPAVPAWATPLAEITLTSSTVSISNSAIVDRRPGRKVLRVLRVNNVDSVTATGGSIVDGTISVMGDRLIKATIWSRHRRPGSVGQVRSYPYVDELVGTYYQTTHETVGSAGDQAGSAVSWFNVSDGLHEIGVWLLNPLSAGTATLVSTHCMFEDAGPAHPDVIWST